MKIIFFAHSESYTGANVVLIENLRRIKANPNILPFVVCNENGNLTQKLLHLEVPFEIITNRWWCGNQLTLRKFVSTVLFNVIATIRIFKLIKKHKFDLAYTNTLTIPSGALACKIANIKHIWYIHEFGKEDHDVNYYFGERITFKMINKLSSKIIAVSKVLKQKCITCGIPDEKIKVIYNRSSKLAPAEKEKVLRIDKPLSLICVGRYSKLKNFEEAIQACKYLKGRIPFHLNIFGGINDSVYYAILEKLIKDLKLKDHIKLNESQKNIEEIYQKSDLMIMPSKMEAFGLVTLEAMSYGLPVIGSNTGANPELLPNHEYLIYNIGEPIELANKIIKIYTNPELYNNLSKNVLKMVSKIKGMDQDIIL